MIARLPGAPDRVIPTEFLLWHKATKIFTRKIQKKIVSQRLEQSISNLKFQILNFNIDLENTA